jgi:hypothetical protein
MATKPERKELYFWERPKCAKKQLQKFLVPKKGKNIRKAPKHAKAQPQRL